MEPRVALAGDGGGAWLVQELDVEQRPHGPARTCTPAQLAGREQRDGPRWVWAATATAYPQLLAAGVRLARCHDLAHTQALLLGHEGRFAELAALGHLSAAGPGGGIGPVADAAQPALFDRTDRAGTDPAAALAEVVTRAGDQARRLAAAQPGLALLAAAESAGALAAVEMSRVGLPWDVTVHDALLERALGPRPGPHGGRPAALAALARELAGVLDEPRLNPDSPAELLRALRRAGLPVTSTRSWELRRYDHPAVPLARRYKELARLWTAHGWAWQQAWVRGGRFHPEYVPAGVVSGRWASRGGGALQIPRAVRAAVRAGPGRVLVVADAGQLEPRVLAALSRDAGLVAATREGDLYASLAAQALGGQQARAEAKVALLSAMYGGGAGSPALAALRHRFPDALGLLERAARIGEEGGSVRSVLGRACPPTSVTAQPSPPGRPPGRRPDPAARARGRFTRNFVVQASAADWAAVLVAGLRTRLAALAPVGGWTAQLVFFQHDEVIVEAAREQADDVVAAIEDAGREATRLVLGGTGVRVPLIATPVTSYADKGVSAADR